MNIIANPNQGFAKNLECLIEVSDEEAYVKRIDYYLALYGMLILLGTLAFMVFF